MATQQRRRGFLSGLFSLEGLSPAHLQAALTIFAILLALGTYEALGAFAATERNCKLCKEECCPKTKN